MSRWLALVDNGGENSIPTPDTLTKPDKTPGLQPEGAICRVMFGCQVEGSNNISEEENASPCGQTVGGRQCTWTGKVVSLAEWRNLSEWERHGSTGKVWNGLTQQWETKP